MKGNILKITAILLILTGSLVSCGKEKDDNNTLTIVAGTKWKVSGIVDVQTGILTEIIPRESFFDDEHRVVEGDTIDCDICYTLVFDTDKDARGRSMYNLLSMKFPDPIQISSTNIPFSERPLAGRTKIGEPPTPTLYVEALANLTSYTYYNDELKLFYNENKNYLLFKLIEQ
jgi:hypothetical protein